MTHWFWSHGVRDHNSRLDLTFHHISLDSSRDYSFQKASTVMQQMIRLYEDKSFCTNITV